MMNVKVTIERNGERVQMCKAVFGFDSPMVTEAVIRKAIDMFDGHWDEAVYGDSQMHLQNRGRRFYMNANVKKACVVMASNSMDVGEFEQAVEFVKGALSAAEESIYPAIHLADQKLQYLTTRVDGLAASVEALERDVGELLRHMGELDELRAAVDHQGKRVTELDERMREAIISLRRDLQDVQAELERRQPFWRRATSLVIGEQAE